LWADLNGDLMGLLLFFFLWADSNWGLLWFSFFYFGLVLGQTQIGGCCGLLFSFLALFWGRLKGGLFGVFFFFFLAQFFYFL
jgi:hypothetical protein